jgi:hypothetical protein
MDTPVSQQPIAAEKREAVKQELIAKYLNPELNYAALDRLAGAETLDGMFREYMIASRSLRTLDCVPPLTYIGWLAEEMGAKEMLVSVHSEFAGLSSIPVRGSGRVSVLARDLAIPTEGSKPPSVER